MSLRAASVKRIPPSQFYPRKARPSRPYEKRRQWDRYWLVDPLDGTKEFIKRNGQFTVNIAYMEAGIPVAGVVHAPAKGLMYWGAAGVGAFKASADGARASVRCGLPPGSGPLRVVGSSSHLSPETRRYLDGLRAEHGDISFVAMGSSLKICLVAEGAADLYPRWPRPWNGIPQQLTRS